MNPTLRHGIFLCFELALRACISPRLRARLLRVLGATVGHNVRVHDCRFINLSAGFRNLVLGDDVHVGNGCLLDLHGPLVIGRGSTLSPRVTVMTHSDPGSAHGSPLAVRFPPEANGVCIGEHCWIGACSTVLSGAAIGDRTVVGAMGLVRGNLAADAVYAGVPVRRIDH